MKDYVFILRHQPLTPEVIAQARPKWAAIIPVWTQQGHLVDSTSMMNDGYLISGEQRVLSNSPVNNDGQIVLTFIRIKAASAEQAFELAKQCPTLDVGGSVEVREVRPAPAPVNN